MRTRYGTLLFLFMLASSPVCRTQISGYSSVSYGYHQNPLYNFEQLSDQIHQAYVELSVAKEWERSSWSLRYTGGLLTFNRFEDRNFYEHSLVADYRSRSMIERPEVMASEEDSTDQDQEVEETPETTFRDSTGRYFGITISLSARHDKPVRSDFDNLGDAAIVSYRFLLSPQTYCRITNSLAYRSYRNVSELSNVNDQLSAELAAWTAGEFVYGVSGSAGFKYYTSSLYDTSRFEGNRTFVEKPTGKGKPGGKELVPSGKNLLLVPQDNGSVQLSGGVFLRKDWSGESSINARILYRWNPRWAVRYLAQQSSASLITQDVYNDFFGYQGPEVHVRSNQMLPARIQIIVEGQFEARTFGVPALTVAGVETGEKRKDLRTGIELSVSRFFGLFGDLGIDVTVSASLTRNQSNDEYNDYSAFSVLGGIGVSF